MSNQATTANRRTISPRGRWPRDEPDQSEKPTSSPYATGTLHGRRSCAPRTQ